MSSRVIPDMNFLLRRTWIIIYVIEFNCPY